MTVQYSQKMIGRAEELTVAGLAESMNKYIDEK